MPGFRRSSLITLSSLAVALVACGDSGGSSSNSSTSVTSPTLGDTSAEGGSQSDSGVSGTSAPTSSASADGTNSNSNSNTNSNSDSGSEGGSDTGIQGSSEGDEGGIKFDVEGGGDIPDGPGPGLGSCRPSEIYGASGGFPAFQDPAYASFLDKKVAIVTHNNWDPAPNNFSLTIVDIDGPPPPPNANYYAPLYHQPAWTLDNLGRIFGLTLDSDGNIYVAATTAYGANPAPNVIKRIDGVTGEISVFATLPNNGPAFGNINYDCVSESFYVSNFEDGRIYQLDKTGAVIHSFHHGSMTVSLGMPADPGEPDGVFAPLGQRPWAVQSNAGRLYYSLWVEHQSQSDPARENEIWSVAYDKDGIVDPATAKLEFSLPTVQGSTNSVPVSDLSFASTGWMLVAQRTMGSDTNTGAHQSTTFEYDYQNGSWVFVGTTYVVGELLPYSAAGGVDHDFAENGYVWMTGDALDFYTPNVVYGLQGTPYGGGGIETSTLIDLDAEVTQQDKTVYGDVELPIPGDASPVPPPS
jgi:hypothetical protein